MNIKIIRIVALVVLFSIVTVGIAATVFWNTHQHDITFIQEHSILFSQEATQSKAGQVFQTFISKVQTNPTLLSTLQKNKKQLMDGINIVQRNNEELGYFEDEVRFPTVCQSNEEACTSIRTVLTAAREDSVLGYQLAFTFWIKENNNKPYAIDYFDLVYDACSYMDNNNPFRGCQVLGEKIISSTLEEEKHQSLDARIQLYAVERSLANNQYAYSYFEATVNRFHNDEALKALIVNDFDSIIAFIWLPDEYRSLFEIDAAAYQQAQAFAASNPWIVPYLVPKDAK
jgi:hypothetical protein